MKSRAISREIFVDDSRLWLVVVAWGGLGTTSGEIGREKREKYCLGCYVIDTCNFSKVLLRLFEEKNHVILFVRPPKSRHFDFNLNSKIIREEFVQENPSTLKRQVRSISRTKKKKGGNNSKHDDEKNSRSRK